MSLSKVDREFYSLMITLLNPDLQYSDRYYEAMDELKHVWRCYYDEEAY